MRKRQKTLDAFGTKRKLTEISKYNIFTIGYLDLTFIIVFNDDDLSQIKNDKIIQYKIDDIKSVKELEFIKDNKNLIKNIKLNSENESIKQFLLLNRMQRGSRQIEFFPICIPNFKDIKFFEEIFDQVTNKYGILINKKSLDEKQNYTIKIHLKHKTNFNIFEYKEEDDQKKNDTNQEENINNSSTNKEKKENENSDEENEAMKLGLIPKFKRKNCLLSNLFPSSKKYDLMYINFSELNKIGGDIEADDLLELISFLKEKKTIIFGNYYKPDKSELADPSDEESSSSDNSNEQSFEDKEEEKKKQKDNNNEEQDNQNNKIFSNQKELNKLYKLTDIFFFDENQSYDLFDRHLKTISKGKSINKLNKEKLFDYFISSIVDHRNGLGEKIGLFLKDLEKFSVITSSRNGGTKQSMDSKPFPKKTVRNIEIINNYKSIIQQNKDDYYSILITFMLGAVSNGKNNILEEINISFMTALTVIKKEIECNKSNIKFNEDKLMNTIRVENKKIKSQYEQKGKENGFVLDCTNKEKSKIKKYLPLNDKNLTWYFNRKTIKNDLIHRGFLDKKGYIMYDKEYKDILGLPKIKNNQNESKSVKSIIKKLSYQNDTLSGTQRGLFKYFNVRTNTRLPFIKK